MRIALCALFALFIAGCQSQEEEKSHRSLYILHAKRGEFRVDSDAPQTEGYLTLFSPDPAVIVFLEATKGKSGTLPLSRFLAKWEHERLFEGREPHAGFLFFEESEKRFSELTVAVHKPIIDPINHTLNFTVFAVEGEFSSEHKEMKEVTLFLDTGEEET